MCFLYLFIFIYIYICIYINIFFLVVTKCYEGDEVGVIEVYGELTKDSSSVSVSSASESMDSWAWNAVAAGGGVLCPFSFCLFSV
jgi:hypothetical protein